MSRLALRQFFLKYPYWFLALGVVFLVWLFSLPKEIFPDPTSTVIEDRDGELLGARIAVIFIFTRG